MKMEAIKETHASGITPWKRRKNKNVDIVDIKMETRLFPVRVVINVVSKRSLRERMSLAVFFPSSASAMKRYRFKHAKAVSEALKKALLRTKTMSNVILSHIGILSKITLLRMLPRETSIANYTSLWNSASGKGKGRPYR